MDRKLSKDVKLILKNRMQKNKGKEDTMASSMIHLAIVQEMRKKVSFRDINRLFLGVILPDGAVAMLAPACFNIWRKVRRKTRNMY